MSVFRAEPVYQHGTVPKTGVLLINLGTPDAPTAKTLRPYLKQFLSDPRVIEIPRALWWPILHGVILATRPKRSAEKYAQIWTADGSPLKVHTERQAKLLRGYLGEKTKAPIVVDYAMRYGAPSIPAALTRLKQCCCDRILLLPLFPQYAASTTGSALACAFEEAAVMRNLPALRVVKHFHDHPRYIAALATSVRSYWEKHGRPDCLVMSFHGVPTFTLEKGDPYHCECQKTARLVAEALGIDEKLHKLAFQSRFGRAKWLQPYTDVILRELGKKKTGRIDVVCPGFVSDCLETLEEIAIEGKAIFLKAGGGEFGFIPCLNESDEWIKALAEIVLQNLGGWLEAEPDRRAGEQAGAASRMRALALGARS
jgi:ferrochelatase